ncbi:MAG: prevent-host-death family protein [bacterium]|nr:MAG: prevent-host-death family protein [bacterium]
MHQIELKEENLELVNLVEAAMRGEEIIIKKDEKLIVKLIPEKTKKANRKAGSAKGMIRIAKDFDEPLEDFREYM